MLTKSSPEQSFVFLCRTLVWQVIVNCLLLSVIRLLLIALLLLEETINKDAWPGIGCMIIFVIHYKIK